MKKLILIFLTFFINGCVQQQNQPSVVVPKSFPQDVKKSITTRAATSEIIEGVVSKIEKETTSSWTLYVKRVTNNGDLEQIHFISKDIANIEVNDKVIVTIRNGVSTNIFTKDNKIRQSKKPLQKKEKILQKRTKDRQVPWIGLPEDSTIKLQ